MTKAESIARAQEMGIDNYTAVTWAEGFEEAPDAEHQLWAWQYIIDMGMTQALQGWFGRTAAGLVARDICIHPGREGCPELPEEVMA